MSKFFVAFSLFFRIFDISIDKTAKNDMINLKKRWESVTYELQKSTRFDH